MNPALGTLFTVLGLVVGGSFYVWGARQTKGNFEDSLRLMMVGVICGALSAAFVQRFIQSGLSADFFSPTSGGRTILAGVAGGWGGIELAKRGMGLKISTGPLWALALSSGEVFGRIGCWFNGCCYGKEYHAFGAVWQHGGWRYPTQFLLSGSALIIFFLVLRLRSLTRIFGLYIVLWAGARFAIEFLREPVSTPTVPYVAQAACLGLIFIVVSLYFTSHRKRVTYSP